MLLDVSVVVREGEFVGTLVGIFEGNDVVGVALIVGVGESVGNILGILEGSLTKWATYLVFWKAHLLLDFQL